MHNVLQILICTILHKFKAVTQKYCKTELGSMFGQIYMYTSMRSLFQGLSDDVLIIILNVVVLELLVIPSID